MAGGGDMALIEGTEADASSSTNIISPVVKPNHHSSSTKKIPANVKAGIDFTVRKTARFLKDGNYAESIDHLAPVYLAAVGEYVAAEILELAGTAAKHWGLTRVESRHIDMAVRFDKESSELFERINFRVCEDDDCNYVYNDNDEDDDISSSDEDEDDDVMEEEKEEDCVVVEVGQMSIEIGREELYRRLIDQFGEIVSSDLSKYMVDVISVALNKLLNVVVDMIDITPETISEELVFDWEEMAKAYSGLGLKIDWFVDRVQRYRNWLGTCSEKNVSQLAGKVDAKRKEVEAKRMKLNILEGELQGFCTELEMAHHARSQFGFTFFDK